MAVSRSVCLPCHYYSWLALTWFTCKLHIHIHCFINFSSSFAVGATTTTATYSSYCNVFLHELRWSWWRAVVLSLLLLLLSPPSAKEHAIIRQSHPRRQSLEHSWQMPKGSLQLHIIASIQHHIHCLLCCICSSCTPSPLKYSNNIFARTFPINSSDEEV